MTKQIETIKCELCGKSDIFFMELHLSDCHNETTMEQYREQYPKARIISQGAESWLTALDNESRNQPKVFNIKKTFKVNLNVDIEGWRDAHVNTPKVDDDYVFFPGALSVVLASLDAGPNEPEFTLLTGPTGAGKTSIIEQACARLNLPVYRVNHNSELTVADIVGQWVLRGKEMLWQDGFLTKAMREGAVYICDEWDVADPGVAMTYQAVLEGKPLTITETAEVIEPNEKFRFFATSNTLGQGDGSSLYNGTQPQNFAQLDRMTMVEFVNYPTRAQEKKIIENKTGLSDKEALDKITRFAKLIRDAFIKEEIMVTMSTRTVVNIVRKMAKFGDIKRAYEIGFINKLTGEDRIFAQEILQRVWAV